MTYGWIIPAAVMAPNALVIAFPPRAIPAKRGPTPLLMTIIERLGQAAVCLVPCLYRLDRIDGLTAWTALAGMSLSLAVYYACWVRYLRTGREYRSLFAPLGPVPLPMAVAPIALFFLSAVLLSSIPMAVATLIFATGHLANSQRERRRCEGPRAP